MSEDNCLTSADALKQIVLELERLLVRHDSSKSRLKDIVSAFSLYSALPWPYIIISLVVIIALLASGSPFGSSQLCALFLLLILIVNGFLATWEVRKKTDEVSARLKSYIDNLKEVYENSIFTDCLALDQFSELLRNCDTAAISCSPSHSISYVYRSCVTRHDNLPTPIPTALLAIGDIISLCPGQSAPAKIRCAEDECCILENGEMFDLSHLVSCTIARNQDESPRSHKFKALESPIVEEIQKFLSSIKKNDAKNKKFRTHTVFDSQRNSTLMGFLKFIIPSVLLSVYVTSTFRYLFLPGPIIPTQDFNDIIAIFNGTIEISISVSNTDPIDQTWYVYFLQTPALVCVPLLPLLLPGLLILLLTIGEAKTVAVCKTDSPKIEKLLTTPTTLTMSSQAVFFRNEALRKMSWRKLLPKLLWGKDGTIFHRNAGLFIPLGSLTELCCVDKEGILSWFNPIAEKVFFFKHTGISHEEVARSESERVHKETFDGSMPPVIEESEDLTNGEGSADIKNDISSPGSEDQRVLSETLALSQDSQDPSRVHFDDVKWGDHLSSLKPIGLNIVLNLCACSPNENPFQFRDSNNAAEMEIMEILSQKKSRPEVFGDVNLDFPHEQALRAIAFNADCLPPGMRMARKGLCSLAELVGFSQNIKIAYSLQQRFTAYKKPICPSLNRLSSSLEQNNAPFVENIGSFTKRNKWKQYLPHIQGAILEDLLGDKQVLVYGTGDLITEQCKEMWDGKEIQPMTIQDRRKAIDFYQRSSVAGQCIAFAYIPLMSQKYGSQKTTKNGNTLLTNLAKSAERKNLVESFQDVEVLNNMIFLGMTTLQHQARFSVCQMVDTLDQACIRFVYFSADNEVRSRVFAEKMGLETGWNCHISLASSPNDSMAHESKSSQLHNRSESSKSRSSSEGGGSKHKHVVEEEDPEDLGSPSSHLIERMSPRTQSESSTTDSLFNVSNRAKLPRGIKNIVPHIENVDNVPLLVPLFTDATPETAGEMIHIMQDNGEVVCCIGSSDCTRNMSVFHQANVSLAFEPIIHPPIHEPSRSQSSQDSISSNLSATFLQRKQSSTPDSIAMEMARKLHCFPCSLLLSGDSGLSVISSMITQARHFLFVLRIFFVFLIKCEMTVSILQLFAHIFLLPAPLAPMDAFWLSIIIIPFLGLSLLASPTDHDLMTWANQKMLPKESLITCFMVRQGVKRYTVKFLPSLVVLLTCYALALHSSCLEVKNLLERRSDNFTENSTMEVLPNLNSSLDVQCYPYFLITVSSSSKFLQNGSFIFASLPLWDATDQLQIKFRTIQLIISFFLVVYLCIVSIGYVNRWRKLTDTLPSSNKLWSITVPLLIICQIVGTAIVLCNITLKHSESKINFSRIDGNVFSTNVLSFGELQTAVWVILVAWPIPCVVFNELWKWREIKMWNRSQKRARLDFGTKLGMNSPF